jgi:hypothetical protein
MTAPAMTDAQNTSQDTSAACEVGYCKPPRHTQFRKGQSGNPGGRPRRRPVRRANALLLAEAYRSVAIKEDGRMVPVTALQAILRSQIELAINGDYRAQRDVLKAVQRLELLKSIYNKTDVDDETDGGGETDQAGESGEEDETDEEDESRAADETGESGEEDEEEDETKLATQYAGNPSPSSGRVDASAASGRVGMTPHRSAAPPGAYGATLPEDGEGGVAPGFIALATGAAVTAPDPATPPENGAASPVSSAPPQAPPRVPSALRRPASPPSRRRTPAGSRGGRRRAVTTRRATGGGPAARAGGGIPRENCRSAETFRKIPVKFPVFRESAARRAPSRPGFAPPAGI